MDQDASRASLELLYNISRDLATSLDLRTIISRVLFLSTQNVGAERGNLIALDKNHNIVDEAIFYKSNLFFSTMTEASTILHQGLAGWVLSNHRAALITDTRQDNRWLLRPDDAADRSGAKSAICVPISTRDQLVGILTVVHPQPGFFTPEHLNLMQAIADQAGVAINNALLYDSLQTAHHRYHELFEDSIDPIWISDWKGKIIEANRKANNIIKSTSSGLTILDLHKPNEEILGKDFQNLHQNNTLFYESDLYSSPNIHIPVEVYVRGVVIEGKNYLQWIMRDISERKDLDALREDLTAMIYHDLRSPLSNVSTSLEMVDMMLPQEIDPNLKVLFSVIKRSTERIQRLISSLLDINRLESHQAITIKEQVKPSQLMLEAIEAVQPSIDSKSQKITLSIPNSLPDLWVDSDMIKRVIINLLDNAMKYTPQEGRLELGSTSENNKIKIWIKDSGPGIPSEAQSKIFNKFARIKRVNMPKGFGLGLAFCRLAIEAHQGTIGVESDGKNGSCFYFILPFSTETT